MSELEGTTEAVKKFILEELLEGEDPNALTRTTELFSSGVLDSLAGLKLIGFLEDEFDVAIEPDEADEEHLDTLESIARLVDSKRSPA